MKTSYSSGFTLIELAIVISIIGILGTFLLVKYIDLESGAKQQATNSVAQSLNVASIANYYFYRLGFAKAVPVNNCIQVANALPSGQPLPPGYTITSLAIMPDATATCTLVNPEEAQRRPLLVVERAKG